MTSRVLAALSCAIILVVALACAGPAAPSGQIPTIKPGVAGQRRDCSPSQDPPAEGCFVAEHDEFRRYTKLLGRFRAGQFLVSLISIPDGPDATDSSVLISIHPPSAGSWQYLRCHTLDILADGQPLPIPETRHSGDVHTGGVSEYVSVDIGDAATATLFAAHSIRARLCTDTFELAPAQIATLGRYAAAWRTLYESGHPSAALDAGADAAVGADGAAVVDAGREAGAR